MEIRERLEKERLFFDGGMGTMLQSAGLMPGELPELWNLSHADVIQGVHEAYIRAGAQIIKTNIWLQWPQIWKGPWHASGFDSCYGSGKTCPKGLPGLWRERMCGP